MKSKILIAIAVTLIILAVIIASRPDEFRVSRTATINAPVSAVFGQINDFHNWNAWSPWAKMDPNAKITYSGEDKNTGAMMAWEGNRDIGAGNMTITEVRPDELIRIKLEMIKPMHGVNDAEFLFASEGKNTSVTWTMSGKSNFMAKAMGLFMDCEKMVGDQFDKGLANLKTLAEAKK